MDAIRATYLDSGSIARDLIAEPVVGERWDEASALPLMTVGALAGHLTRVFETTERYLDGDPPHGSTIDAPAYYAGMDLGDDLESDAHRGIRDRGAEAAAGGQAALVASLDDRLDRLDDRLHHEPAGREIGVAFGTMRMTLDEYLKTRLVELVVHVDDLAASVELPMPELEPLATATVIDVLLGAARIRHGDLAVIRALSRQERDDLGALRVL